LPSGRTGYIVSPESLETAEIIDVALIVSLSPIDGASSGSRAA
jgi:hypothetical protein